MTRLIALAIALTSAPALLAQSISICPVTTYYQPPMTNHCEVPVTTYYLAPQTCFYAPAVVETTTRVPINGPFSGQYETFRSHAPYTKVVIDNATGSDNDFQVVFVDFESRESRKSPITRVRYGEVASILVEGRIEPNTSGSQFDIYAIGKDLAWKALSGSAVVIRESGRECEARELTVKLGGAPRLVPIPVR